ncbi:MAG: leucine-rich repeat protein [Ruminococcus sp.]|nr:leucine-rich repeat protein [Ruminococcus sp.]
MKKHYKFIAGIMAVSIVFGVGVIPDSIAPIVSITASAETIKSGACGEKLTWVLDDEGTLTISGTGDMTNYAPYFNVGLPPYHSDKIKEVIIEDGVTSIGDYAFYGCSSLTSVTVSDSVKSIGYGAFYDTLWLEEKQEENPLVIINNIVIDGQKCSDDVVIPDGVTSIEDYAFSDCSSLTSVTIPDSVTSIGAAAFDDCSNLTSVTIPDSVTSIGINAFNRCSSLTSVTIPDSVTSIGSGAFLGCSNLTSVTIPDGVTSIGGSTFYNCSNLTSVTIPDSVTSIGGRAFYNCSSLISAIIPDSVTRIGDYAFSDCISLTSVTISDSMTSIEDFTFSGCSSLTSVTIPDSVTSIGMAAFCSCSSLTSVTIPDSVINIGDSAFGSCGNLTKIIIPDSVTSIGDGALYGCGNLTEITILNPECEMYRCGIYDGYTKNYLYATIYGYENSTAQAYAERYDYKFESLGKAPEKITATGDMNGDGEFNVADVVVFHKYILGTSDKEISDWKQADLNYDGLLDSFDLIMMRQKLIEK